MSGDRPVTLHDRILADVRSNIVGGDWPPGHRIPFETEMAEAYGVSRMTVNKVLTLLTRDGYLERRRKGGTFVTRPRGQSAVMAISSVRDEVEGLGYGYSFDLIRRKTRRASPQDLLQLQTSAQVAEVMELEYLHRADDVPFCHEMRLINLDAVPLATSADFAADPAGIWLLRQVPWSSAEHLIRAVAPAAPVARLLDIPPVTPCMEIARRTEFEDQPVTFARFTYPGSKHQVSARFAPEG